MTERPERPFPEPFLWGAATASYQIEGAAHEDGRGPSIWDDFSHTPGKVNGGDTGDVACDHYHRVEEDVALMADIGLQGYRCSLSWSRLLPEGKGRLNDAGVAFYSRLFDLLLEHGITPCVTLFHWDLPSALEARGGFRDRDTAKYFGDYAAKAVELFGDRVGTWATFNEPWCHAYLGHANGRHAPGMTDWAAAVAVAHHEQFAHGLAIEAMRAERSGLSLGTVYNPSPVATEGSPEASSDAIRRIDGLHNRWWFDSVLKGNYPSDVLDDLEPFVGDLIQAGDAEQIAQPLDWIGINYYSDILVRSRTPDDVQPEIRDYPNLFGVAPSPTRSDHTDMGWPITPEGFTALLVRLRDDYPNLPPVYITENGCAYDDPVVAGRVEDRRRVDYLDRYLRALRDAIDAGVDVRGYYQWSLMDNFEWAHGYTKRFGLVHVDFDTLERTPRDSAWWYRDVIRSNAVPARVS